jgi:hypothetical protein
MADLKTKLSNTSVADFINAIPDPQMRDDCRAIARIMQDATKAEPKMWGTGIVGFGTYRQVYANGKEADWMLVAFAPRKTNVALYIGGGFAEYEELRSSVGKCSGGKGCLNVKRLSDLHLPALKKLIRASVLNRTKSARRT